MQNIPLCPAQENFDAIAEKHSNAHRAAANIWKDVKLNYSNITLDMCKNFIELCSVCVATASCAAKKKNTKGPGISIISSGFCDRIQVDLVDFSSEPAQDHNSVVMKYLMTIKGHFSQYKWLRPLAKKEAHLVATELHRLFHEIGFLLIIHSDNGGEFINDQVYI